MDTAAATFLTDLSVYTSMNTPVKTQIYSGFHYYCTPRLWKTATSHRTFLLKKVSAASFSTSASPVILKITKAGNCVRPQISQSSTRYGFRFAYLEQMQTQSDNQGYQVSCCCGFKHLVFKTSATVVVCLSVNLLNIRV